MESKPLHEASDQLCGWLTESALDAGATETGELRAAVSDDQITRGANASAAVAVGIVATAMCVKAGVSVEQIIEPFALAGPCFDNSLDAVHQFQRWWEAAAKSRSELTNWQASSSDLIQFDFQRVEVASKQRAATLIPLESAAWQSAGTQEEELAPIVSAALGRSVLVARFKGFPSDPIALQVGKPLEHPLVGSSPMIFTLEESYMAYDMADRDVKLWCVRPTTTRPFCIRDRSGSFDAAPIFDELDVLVKNESKASVASLASQFQCSAFCALDQCVKQLEDWTAPDSSIRQVVQPSSLGRQFAFVMSQRDHLAVRAAIAVGSRWRTVKPVPMSPVGAALLARGGARVERGPLIDAVANDAITRIAQNSKPLSSVSPSSVSPSSVSPSSVSPSSVSPSSISPNTADGATTEATSGFSEQR